MTTIIMVQGTDDVLMGWDSMMTNGHEASSLVAPKVFANGNVIYGISGTLRAGDVLQYGDLPTYDKSVYPDARRWINNEWVPAFRELLAEEPSLINDKFELKSWGLLMVVDGQAYEFDVALNASQSVEGVYTMGSGGDYARGAIFAGASVMSALYVAGRLDTYTGGGYTVASAAKYLKNPSPSEATSGRLDTPTLF